MNKSYINVIAEL